MLESIEHKALEQLLIRHTYLHWVAPRTVLTVPGVRGYKQEVKDKRSEVN